MDDNTVQHVYAGDLSGNIWRFDINADTVSLLASVGSGGGTTQPVTSRVELGDILDSSGGQANQRAIYVGTGRYLGMALTWRIRRIVTSSIPTLSPFTPFAMMPMT